MKGEPVRKFAVAAAVACTEYHGSALLDLTRFGEEAAVTLTCTDNF